MSDANPDILLQPVVDAETITNVGADEVASDDLASDVKLVPDTTRSEAPPVVSEETGISNVAADEIASDVKIVSEATSNDEPPVVPEETLRQDLETDVSDLNESTFAARLQVSLLSASRKSVYSHLSTVSTNADLQNLITDLRLKMLSARDKEDYGEAERLRLEIVELKQQFIHRRQRIHNREYESSKGDLSSRSSGASQALSLKWKAELARFDQAATAQLNQLQAEQAAIIAAVLAVQQKDMAEKLARPKFSRNYAIEKRQQLALASANRFAEAGDMRKFAQKQLQEDIERYRQAVQTEHQHTLDNVKAEHARDFGILQSRLNYERARLEDTKRREEKWLSNRVHIESQELESRRIIDERRDELPIFPQQQQQRGTSPSPPRPESRASFMMAATPHTPTLMNFSQLPTPAGTQRHSFGYAPRHNENIAELSELIPNTPSRVTFGHSEVQPLTPLTAYENDMTDVAPDSAMTLGSLPQEDTPFRDEDGSFRTFDTGTTMPITPLAPDTGASTVPSEIVGAKNADLQHPASAPVVPLLKLPVSAPVTSTATTAAPAVVTAPAAGAVRRAAKQENTSVAIHPASRVPATVPANFTLPQPSVTRPTAIASVGSATAVSKALPPRKSRPVSDMDFAGPPVLGTPMWGMRSGYSASSAASAGPTPGASGRMTSPPKARHHSQSPTRHSAGAPPLATTFTHTSASVPTAHLHGDISQQRTTTFATRPRPASARPAIVAVIPRVSEQPNQTRHSEPRTTEQRPYHSPIRSVVAPTASATHGTVQPPPPRASSARRPQSAMQRPTQSLTHSNQQRPPSAVSASARTSSPKKYVATVKRQSPERAFPRSVSADEIAAGQKRGLPIGYAILNAAPVDGISGTVSPPQRSPERTMRSQQRPMSARAAIITSAAPVSVPRFDFTSKNGTSQYPRPASARSSPTKRSMSAARDHSHRPPKPSASAFVAASTAPLEEADSGDAYAHPRTMKELFAPEAVVTAAPRDAKPKKSKKTKKRISAAGFERTSQELRDTQKALHSAMEMLQTMVSHADPKALNALRKSTRGLYDSAGSPRSSDSERLRYYGGTHNMPQLKFTAD